MALSRTSRKPLPIEVRGTPRYPLGMSPEQFLRDYWQKHPLLIRQAFSHFRSPVEPEDLAGLACEEGALSRLIQHDEDRQRWRVKAGPLSESDFAKTGDANWTLLVQDVDKWDMDVAALLDHFRFLPNWRIDDVMISYAEPGGGVGAHIDHYDVFLLQGLGQRHWAISTDPLAPKAFRSDVELKQLEHFEPTHEWLLEAGDMLYLPPGIPHDGVAFGGPCMTFSVGMRAPSQAELVGDLADYLAERLQDEQRYTDPDLEPVKRPGEIDKAALQRVRVAVPFSTALEDATLIDWFGRFITRYRSAQTPLSPSMPFTEAAFTKQLAGGASLLRHPWARMAWAQTGSRCTLYANGHAYPASVRWAARLCAERTYSPPFELSGTERALLLTLVNDGYLVLRRLRGRGV